MAMKFSLAGRSDLGVVAVLVISLALMIVPLPAFIVDMLITCNMVISLVILMTVFYLQTPAQFVALPSVILVATVFRLSLSIGVTRLILTTGDAGDIIRTFGNMVVGGNLVVGLVIFLIVTVVQFIVITKGGERIAEVAARFTLDAMPGKQMAIDADVRSKELDQAAAQVRRGQLQRESQLYGAMDGAMKFVKGDSIAGLIIIMVNMIGGLIVGVAQRGMSFGDAASNYTMLTVGDGLVAQIPALLISIASGALVTRVVGEDGESMGGEIASQLARDGRALWLASGVTLMMGLIPGFPIVMFLGMGGMLGFLARKASRRQSAEKAAAVAKKMAVEKRVQICLAQDLLTPAEEAAAAAAIAVHQAEFLASLGFALPQAEIKTIAAPAGTFLIRLDGTAIGGGALPPGRLLLRDGVIEARLLGMDLVPGPTLPGFRDPVWIPADTRAGLQKLGIRTSTGGEVVAEVTLELLRNRLGHLFGVQEAQAVFTKTEIVWGDLAREAQKAVPLQRAADMFRRLLEEGLGLVNMRGLLEAMVEHGERDKEPLELIEAVRFNMRREICLSCADERRIISAIIIDAEYEEFLRTIQYQVNTGTLDELNSHQGLLLVEQIRSECAASAGPTPVIMTAPDVRSYLGRILWESGVFVKVIAFNEILPDFMVQPLSFVAIGSQPAG
jgi:type III secretion protein V